MKTGAIIITAVIVSCFAVVSCAKIKGPSFQDFVSPRVTVDTPASPASDNVSITFTLISSDGANVDADISYSAGGGPFIVCALANSSATGLSTAPYPGIAHTVYWNSVANGAGLSGAVNVTVKVDAGGTPGTTESFSVVNTDHNAPPSASVQTPSGTKYGNVRIDYSLIDSESNNCSIIAYYSADTRLLSRVILHICLTMQTDYMSLIFQIPFLQH